jgi:excisionase family DNA binding protein
MSSNIQVQRICQFCGKEFTARTTVTKYCGDDCAKRAYKARERAAKVELSNKETLSIKTKPYEDLKAKEFLTAREVATLLNCSLRSVYYYIESGNINAVNLGQRITRVKRSEIDKLFELGNTNKPENALPINEPQAINETDCYTLPEIQSSYGISQKALYELIKRNNIPKLRNGKTTIVPKNRIIEILGEPKTNANN